MQRRWQEYGWFNTTENLLIDDEDISLLNPYMGGALPRFAGPTNERRC